MTVYIVRAFAKSHIEGSEEVLIRVFNSLEKALEKQRWMHEAKEKCFEKYGFRCYRNIRVTTATVE